jgi:imidazole glycerol phosphate synthase glutamine amidotransferase subunit
MNRGLFYVYGVSMITLVDYDSGNIRSVTKALESLGAEVEVTDQPERINNAEKLVVPGVGAFGDAMEKLHQRKLIEPLRKFAKTGKPFLGICVGLQLLFEGSEEAEGVEGLGILPGIVRRFESKPERKIPHMGWNQIHPRPDYDMLGIFKDLSGVASDPYVYFVHSYFAVPTRPDHILATCNYDGVNFCAAAGNGQVAGVQFHPEKSQSIGMKLLKNFAG